MYFVTTYSLYPIYEPAEGGYYYEGVEIRNSRAFQSRRKAKQYINKLYRLEIACGENQDKYWFAQPDNTLFGCGSKFIGEGWYVTLERKQGAEEKGWEPYC